MIKKRTEHSRARECPRFPPSCPALYATESVALLKSSVAFDFQTFSRVKLINELQSSSVIVVYLLNNSAAFSSCDPGRDMSQAKKTQVN